MFSRILFYSQRDVPEHFNSDQEETLLPKGIGLLYAIGGQCSA